MVKYYRIIMPPQLFRQQTGSPLTSIHFFFLAGKNLHFSRIIVISIT